MYYVAECCTPRANDIDYPVQQIDLQGLVGTWASPDAERRLPSGAPADTDPIVQGAWMRVDKLLLRHWTMGDRRDNIVAMAFRQFVRWL